MWTTNGGDGTLWCLACGSSSREDDVTFQLSGHVDVEIKTEPVVASEEESLTLEGPNGNAEDDISAISSQRSIYNSFCELLRVTSSSVDEDGVEDVQNSEEWLTRSVHPSFCSDCQNHIHLLKDLQLKLKELQKDLENGISELRRLCEKGEFKFGNNGAYDRDKRYLQIRRQICPVTWPKDPPSSSRPTRRSGRKSKPVTHSDFISSDLIPDPSSSNRQDSETPIQLTSNSENNFYAGYDPLETAADDEPPASPVYLKTPIRKRKAKSSTKINEVPPKEFFETKRPRKIRVKADEDYIPSDDDNNNGDDNSKYSSNGDDSEFSEDDDELQRYHEKKSKRWIIIKPDPVTGKITYKKIPFEKLANGKYQCSECDSKVVRSSIKDHVHRTHSDLFACQECGKRCRSSIDLKHHIKSMHRGQKKEKAHKCPICEKPFHAPYRVRKHMVSHMSAEEKAEAIANGEKLPEWEKGKIFFCEECGKGYDSEANLQYHKIQKHPSEDHTEELKLMHKEMCPDCGKLILKSTMKSHRLRVHSNGEQKRFICSVCDKRFFKAVELQIHKNAVHDNVRPWKCAMCPKAYTAKKQLTMHMKSCQNIRAFQCDVCPMAFVRKHHLERHFQVYHTEGSKPRRHKHLNVIATK